MVRAGKEDGFLSQNRYGTFSMCSPVQRFLPITSTCDELCCGANACVVCCADVLGGLNDCLKPAVVACHLTLFLDVPFLVWLSCSHLHSGLLAPQSDALLLFLYDKFTVDRSAEDAGCSGDHAPKRSENIRRGAQMHDKPRRKRAHKHLQEFGV